MFGTQCEQAAASHGCTGKAGMCGKQEDTALLQDRLTGALIRLAHAVVGNEELIRKQTHQLVREALSTTIANVNFNNETIRGLLERVAKEKQRLVPQCQGCDHPCGRNDDYDMSLLWNANDDICNLKSLLLFSIRGMAAQAHRAAVLGYTDEMVDTFFLHALDVLGNEWNTESLLPIVMKAGEVNLRCRELLDNKACE